MKKLAMFFVAMLMSVAVFADMGDMFETRGYNGKYFRIDSNANVITNGQFISSGTIDTVNVEQFWQDVPIASTMAVGGSGYGITMTSATLAKGTSIYYDSCNITQPKYARTIGARWDVPFSSNTFHNHITFYGTDIKGNGIYETVIATVGAQNLTSKAFAWISSWTATTMEFGVGSTDIPGGTMDGVIRLNLEQGPKLGLMEDVKTNTSDDVYWVIEGGTSIALTSVTVNPTYDTIDFATDPDNTTDYIVYMHSKR